MKILHLIDSGGLYGAEKMLLALVKAQREQGLEPMILSAGEPGIKEKPIEAEAKRLELPIMPWRMKPGLNIQESRRILKWATANGYDILHSHGFKFNVLLGSYPRIIRGIPMVATLHGYVHARRFSKMWLYELLDRFAITFLQGVVLVGEAMKKELSGKLSESKKVRVIKNGLNIKGVNELANQSVESTIEDFIANHSPIILGVGRLSEEKGFDRLIDAFQMLCAEFENPGLIIVGEGKQKGALTARVNNFGIQNQVCMPGYCENVPGLQRRSDLLVIPSMTEGLPITLLEAMSVGVAVLVAPVGEMPAVLGYGEGGYIMPENCESSELALLISDILHDENQSLKIDWSKKAVMSSCSVEAMERSYRDLYSALVVACNG